MTGNPGLVNLNKLRFKPDLKAAAFFEFYDDKNKWVLLQKKHVGFMLQEH